MVELEVKLSLSTLWVRGGVEVYLFIFKPRQ